MPAFDIRKTLRTAGLAQRVPSIESAADDNVLSVETVLNLRLPVAEVPDDVDFTAAVKTNQRWKTPRHLVHRCDMREPAKSNRRA